VHLYPLCTDAGGQAAIDSVEQNAPLRPTADTWTGGRSYVSNGIAQDMQASSLTAPGDAAAADEVVAGVTEAIAPEIAVMPAAGVVVGGLAAGFAIGTAGRWLVGQLFGGNDTTATQAATATSGTIYDQQVIAEKWVVAQGPSGCNFVGDTGYGNCPQGQGSQAGLGVYRHIVRRDNGVILGPPPDGSSYSCRDPLLSGTTAGFWCRDTSDPNDEFVVPRTTVYALELQDADGGWRLWWPRRADECNYHGFVPPAKGRTVNGFRDGPACAGMALGVQVATVGQLGSHTAPPKIAPDAPGGYPTAGAQPATRDQLANALGQAIVAHPKYGNWLQHEVATRVPGLVPNPGTYADPANPTFPVPVPAAHETFAQYSARLTAAGITAAPVAQTLTNTDEDPTRGPSEVVSTAPAGGSYVPPATTVTVDLNPPNAPSPSGATPGGGIDLSPLRNIPTPCNVFPFGVPCWLVRQVRGLAGDAVAPQFDLPVPFVGNWHIDFGHVFGQDTTVIRDVLWPIELFASFVALVVWLAGLAMGGSTGGGGRGGEE
jgi:hypothetical protein